MACSTFLSLYVWIPFCFSRSKGKQGNLLVGKLSKKRGMHIIKRAEFLSGKSGESMELRLIGADQVDRFIRQGKGILVDLRRPSDFYREHLQGARNIPYDELEDYIQILPKTCPILLYCDRGSTSLLAGRWLSRLGLDVISVIGGISAYRGKYLTSGKY